MGMCWQSDTVQCKVTSLFFERLEISLIKVDCMCGAEESF